MQTLVYGRVAETLRREGRGGGGHVPAPVTPHPGMGVAVNERQFVPNAHGEGHSVKPGPSTAGREPVPHGQRASWGHPAVGRRNNGGAASNRAPGHRLVATPGAKTPAARPGPVATLGKNRAQGQPSSRQKTTAPTGPGHTPEGGTPDQGAQRDEHEGVVDAPTARRQPPPLGNQRCP